MDYIVNDILVETESTSNGTQLPLYAELVKKFEENKEKGE